MTKFGYTNLNTKILDNRGIELPKTLVKCVPIFYAKRIYFTKHRSYFSKNVHVVRTFLKLWVFPLLHYFLEFQPLCRNERDLDLLSKHQLLKRQATDVSPRLKYRTFS